MATPVPAHPVPAGPLAVRWHAHEVKPPRAGVSRWIRVELENAGAATWREHSGTGIFLGYHWLDLRGNAIVWAPHFIPLPWPIPPGLRFELEFPVRAPIPPGRYRLALDLVDEGRSWFAELGNHRLELVLDVLPRLEHRTLAVRVEDGPAELVEATRSALDAQEEAVAESGDVTAFLAAGCSPAPDWSRRILDLHEEGYAAVGGSVAVEGGLLERRRGADELGPWKPGFGRKPAWSLPLLCPSLVADLLDEAPWTEPVAGMPALDPASLDEPWLCDGRVRLSIPARALRSG